MSTLLQSIRAGCMGVFSVHLVLLAKEARATNSKKPRIPGCGTQGHATGTMQHACSNQTWPWCVYTISSSSSSKDPESAIRGKLHHIREASTTEPHEAKRDAVRAGMSTGLTSGARSPCLRCALYSLRSHNMFAPELQTTSAHRSDLYRPKYSRGRLNARECIA